MTFRVHLAPERDLVNHVDVNVDTPAPAKEIAIEQFPGRKILKIKVLKEAAQ